MYTEHVISVHACSKLHEYNTVCVEMSASLMLKTETSTYLSLAQIPIMTVMYADGNYRNIISPAATNHLLLHVGESLTMGHRIHFLTKLKVVSKKTHSDWTPN